MKPVDTSLLIASTKSFKPLRSSSREKKARRQMGFRSPACDAGSMAGITFGITMLHIRRFQILEERRNA